MTIKVICQALELCFRQTRTRLPACCPLVPLFLACSLLPGCVLVQARPYPPPLQLAAMASLDASGRQGAASWPYFLAVLAGIGLVIWAFRRLGAARRNETSLDREDLALLRTARDALLLFNRKKRSGPSTPGGPKKI